MASGAPGYLLPTIGPPPFLPGSVLAPFSGSSRLSTPGTTGALSSASAILRRVSLVTLRPRRAPEMVEGLQPDALARSVALQPRRASSRSIRAGLMRTLIGFESHYRCGLQEVEPRGPGGRMVRGDVPKGRLTPP